MQAGPGELAFDLKGDAEKITVLANMLRATDVDVQVTGETHKCPTCNSDCEVYSRIVGYLRPVSQWNSGKQAEFKMRELFVPEVKAKVKIDSKTKTNTTK
jgi:hypothetical protein